MRRYESVIILDPELADDDIKNFTERYSTLIKTNGGEIIKIEDWGFKRLAYLVKKKERGRYILFDFVGLPALIAEMERQLKIADEVMKFLSVKLDEDVDLEAFKAASEEKAAAEAAKLAPPEPAPAAAEVAEPAAQEPEEPAKAPEVAEPAAQEAGEPEKVAEIAEPAAQEPEEPAKAAEAAQTEEAPKSAGPAGGESSEGAPKAKKEEE
ncbi:MAG: 30S ribosomal protein S6 [Desulfomonile tiedjei]|nr:30S ribosomal protein S6 [Desulfomonile tiedjei]